MTKETFPVVNPKPESKEDYAGSGYFLFFCFLLLPFGSMAQPPLTLAEVINFQNTCSSTLELEKQEIPLSEAGIVRFKELGTIYNPKYPATRNRVYTHSFHFQDSNYQYIGKSISTHRATVLIEDRVGEFVGLWKGEIGTSIIRYQVTRTADNFLVTGNLYTKCRAIN